MRSKLVDECYVVTRGGTFVTLPMTASDLSLYRRAYGFSKRFLVSRSGR